MVYESALAYSYRGNSEDLLHAVKKACAEMSLRITDERSYAGGFDLTAGEKTSWLSTNWPVKFNVSAEAIGGAIALTIKGASSIGSITQQSNNHNKAQSLLSLISAYAPNL